MLSLLIILMLINITTSLVEERLNVLFISRAGKDNEAILGSTLMRGYMMKDSFNTIGMNAEVVIYSDFHDKSIAKSEIISFATKYHLNACIFIKFYSIEIASTCNLFKAFLLFDVIDGLKTLNYLNNIVQLTQTSFVKNTMSLIPNKNKKYELRKLLKNAYNAIWLMQSDYLTTLFNQFGIMSYTFQHHHSNTNNWDLSIPTINHLNTSNHSNKLVLGILYGSKHNEPNIKFIFDILCDMNNLELWLIYQHFSLTIIGSSSELITTRTEYYCDYHQKIQMNKRIFRNNRTSRGNSSNDIYGQEVYYTDNALQGVDVGIVLIKQFDNKLYLKKDIITNQIEMLRPPTRFLHWLSRGIPTLYYPTLAYKDIADHYQYGHSVNMSLCVLNKSDLKKAITLLYSYEVRKLLSMEGIVIAKNFTILNTAYKLINIIKDVQIKNPTSYNTNQNLSLDSNNFENYLPWILLIGCIIALIGFYLFKKCIYNNNYLISYINHRL